MLSLLVTLAMPPMMGGKGGKGGKGNQKFSIKPFLKGSYEVDVFEQNQRTNEFQWQGKTTFDNATNITALSFEAVEVVTIPDGENATKTDRIVHETKNIYLTTDNTTHLRCVSDDVVIFDAVFQLDNRTGYYYYSDENTRIVIHNYLYVEVFRFENGHTKIYEIVKKKETAPYPWYMKLLQPAMLILNLFITMKMKGKYGYQAGQNYQAQQPVQPYENYIPQDNDGTYDGEEKKEQEKAKDEIKDDKKED